MFDDIFQGEFLFVVAEWPSLADLDVFAFGDVRHQFADPTALGLDHQDFVRRMFGHRRSLRLKNGVWRLVDNGFDWHWLRRVMRRSRTAAATFNFACLQISLKWFDL